MPRTTDTAFAIRLGARLRAARIAARLSQTALGERLSLSFQQVQKYELGKDRISVERLVRIAELLGRPVAEFVEAEGDVEPSASTVDLRSAMRAAEALNRLSPVVRGKLQALVEALVAADAAPAAEAA